MLGPSGSVRLRLWGDGIIKNTLAVFFNLRYVPLLGFQHSFSLLLPSLSLRHETQPSVNTVVCQDRSALDFRCLTSELWKVWGGIVSQISNRCHQHHEIKSRTAPLSLWDRQMGVEGP